MPDDFESRFINKGKPPSPALIEELADIILDKYGRGAVNFSPEQLKQAIDLFFQRPKHRIKSRKRKEG